MLRAVLHLDEVDHEILMLLQQDGRRTVADIAQRVALSAAPVRRRIDRLEATGVIKGYAAIVDEARLGRGVDAFTELRVTGNTGVGGITAIVQGLPQVRAVFTTAGDPDALVWLRVKDFDDLKGVINELRRKGKVTGTKTLMVLDTWTPVDRPL